MWIDHKPFKWLANILNVHNKRGKWVHMTQDYPIFALWLAQDLITQTQMHIVKTQWGKTKDNENI